MSGQKPEAASICRASSLKSVMFSSKPWLAGMTTRHLPPLPFSSIPGRVYSMPVTHARRSMNELTQLAGARFATPCRAKALPWLLPGSMTATPLGVVSFLEASLWQCFLLLHSGFSGGNSRSSLGRARVTLLHHFPVGASF
jgi:hypothetical protein